EKEPASASGVGREGANSVGSAVCSGELVPSPSMLPTICDKGEGVSLFPPRVQQEQQVEPPPRLSSSLSPDVVHPHPDDHRRSCPHAWTLEGGRKCGECGERKKESQTATVQRQAEEERRRREAYEKAQAKRRAEEERRMQPDAGDGEGLIGDDFL